MDGLEGHCVKLNKLGKERQMVHDLTEVDSKNVDLIEVEIE